MGATDFNVTIKAKTAADAFKKAQEQAFYDHGHDGYTGSIAEKSSFMMHTPPKTLDLTDVSAVRKYCWDLFDADDKIISNKWGPAACIDLKNGSFLFFGLASI